MARHTGRRRLFGRVGTLARACRSGPRSRRVAAADQASKIAARSPAAGRNIARRPRSLQDLGVALIHGQKITSGERRDRSGAGLAVLGPSSRAEPGRSAAAVQRLERGVSRTAYAGTPDSRRSPRQASSATRERGTIACATAGASSAPRMAPESRGERGADARHVGQRRGVGGWMPREAQQHLRLEQRRAPGAAPLPTARAQPSEARRDDRGSRGAATARAGSDRTRRTAPAARRSSRPARAGGIRARGVRLDRLDARLGPPAPLDHRATSRPARAPAGAHGAAAPRTRARCAERPAGLGLAARSAPGAGAAGR